MENIAMLGAGAMGTAIAIYLAKKGHETNLWGTHIDKDIIKTMLKTKMHKSLHVALPSNIDLFYADRLQKALEERKIVVLAVSSDGIPKITREMIPFLKENMIIMNVAKGLQEDTYLTMSDVIKNEIRKNLTHPPCVVAVGGPARASELANGIPIQIVFASSNTEATKFCKKVFSSSTLKVNLSPDIVGVELCAAMKNSYAIAMGICEGLQSNVDSPKAALISQALLEISKIVVAKGGNLETVAGPAGIGDLYVTAQGGRNRTFGKLLGQGMSVKEALEKVGRQTIEGYPTLKKIYKLVQKLQNQGKLKFYEDFALLRQLYAVLYEGRSAREAIEEYWSTSE